jgi:hypothetical protein
MTPHSCQFKLNIIFSLKTFFHYFLQLELQFYNKLLDPLTFPLHCRLPENKNKTKKSQNVQTTKQQKHSPKMNMLRQHLSMGISREVLSFSSYQIESSSPTFPKDYV